MNMNFEVKDNAVVVNNRYLIDIPSGTVYYYNEYIGNRDKEFPRYVFSIVELLKQLGVVK